MNKKFLRHFLSVLLVLILCCMAGLTAFAAGTGGSDPAATVLDTVLEDEEVAGDADADTSAVVEVSGAENNGQTDNSSSGEIAEEDITTAEVTEEDTATDEAAEEDTTAGETTVEDTAAGEATAEDTTAGEAAETDESEMNTEVSGEGTSEETSALSEEQESGEEETDLSAGSTYYGIYDIEAELEAIIESIREEYGNDMADSVAASMEKLLNNENVKEFAAAVEDKIQKKFAGMTEDEIVAAMESMSEEELAAWMESLMSDPEIEALLEKLANDEELAAELESLFQMFMGDIEFDDDSGLTETVSGKQGSNITWTLTTDGVLTISGNGAIVPDYKEYDGLQFACYAWDEYTDYVTKIVIKDGVTNIPDDAFWLASVKTVVIPASVNVIASYALADCAGLTSVYFYGDAPVIAKDAFGDEIPSGLTLYYLEGTTGWDKLEGYNLAVWDGSSTDINGTGASDGKDDGAANNSNAGNAGSAANGSQNTPDTGDTANPYIFLVLMAAAVICGGLIIFKVRKNKSR